ncbi:winged helix-turn-helix domain-containing protein [Sphingomonas sp.]|uniref:ATP-binding protein n=1 Tax=Sphingomonas sp. TaxID=28214 RepID=UPI001B2BEF91|nr:winged helix-turn-helix domain-containing protein [Sphingomonas sp.]MBO9714778.1 winged helix-turn-helix domain-containing protein [Sphingomonas sp.]
MSGGNRLAFGDFEYAPARQALFRNGAAVPLSGRIADVLDALLERPGELQAKEELLARVWPGRIVEEVNLRAQIAALRRVLGCGQGGARYIATVAGRGYRFVAPVHPLVEGDARTPVVDLAQTPAVQRPLTPIVGREAPLAEIADALRHRRQVTITGPGGIGKTSVALTAAAGAAGEFPGGTLFIDCSTALAGLPELLLAALGMRHEAGDWHALQGALPSTAHLFVLDGCEARLDEAADVATLVLRRAPRSAIVLTSREPVGAEAETVLRLGPLSYPGRDDLPADELMGFGAVELFFARAPLGFTAAAAGDLATIARICRLLEGNPLAIELAASQVDRRGIEGLAEIIEQPGALRIQGPRTASPQNRSIEASIEYGFDRLSEVERGLMFSLSVFTRAFTREAAHAVVATPLPDLCDHITNLAAKSLLIVTRSVAGTTFAMPRLVRLYSFEQLKRSPHYSSAMRRLAQQLRRELEERTVWHCVNNDELARALDWCFADPEREELSLALTLSAVPYWFDQGAFGEALGRLGHAIALVANGPRRRVELDLRSALVTLLVSRIARTEVQVDAARTLIALAEAVGDPAARIRGEWALWSAHVWTGEFAAARYHAERVEAIAEAEGDVEGRIAAHRLMGIALHFAGEHAAALTHLDRVLGYFPLPERSTQNIPFQYDQRIAGLCYRARILYLQGDTEQALRAAETALSEGEAIGHLLSIIYILAIATCPIMILTGRAKDARIAITRLRAAVDALRIPAWQEVAKLFEDWLAVAHDPAPRLTDVNRALASVRASAFGPVCTMAAASLAEALARAGAVPEALALADTLIERAENAGELWILPEVMRIRAEMQLRVHGQSHRRETLAALHRALALAEEQGATCPAAKIRAAIAAADPGITKAA